MSIDDLIESIGLPADALRQYVVDELDEFLAATSPGEQESEFRDVVFALRAIGWAHTGRHLSLSTDAFERKVRERLRRYATLTRHEPRYLHDRLPELEYGVIHFAFGHFTGQWTEFDPLKNGTVAEIHLLTVAPFEQMGRLANQVIVTFDETEYIEYAIIDGATDIGGGNIALCRIPDFLYRQAKRTLRFHELADYLSRQVLAALDGLRLTEGAIAHFHSWECAFLVASTEFRERMAGIRTIFSPYLTIGPLRQLLDDHAEPGWTMTRDELEVAADQEQRLSQWATSVVLESDRDRAFYERWVPAERLDFRSFARVRSVEYPSDPPDSQTLSFVAGGRPVREKGFVELCREFRGVQDWARRLGLTADLAVLCRERRPDKGADYIAELEGIIRAAALEGIVHLEFKVSLEQLRRRIAGASAVIVPSLYDPYGLMATYAVEVERPAFVSIHAGVSENVQDPAFTFDPWREGDLLRVISSWYEQRPIFRFQTQHPSYESLYLSEGVG